MAAIRCYPWKRWLRKKCFCLIYGEDFSCMPHSMSVQIRSAATKAGKRASIRISAEGNLTVTIKEAPRRKKQAAIHRGTNPRV